MEFILEENKSMCRLLAVKSLTPVNISSYLHEFAKLSKNSKEYQGHGWGVTYLNEKGDWESYKNINPIWKETDFEDIPSSTFFLAHARSAFQNEGITIENNMPFSTKQLSFIFNGELHGVRLKQEGRIGAEKVFNLIQGLYRGNLLESINRGISVIEKRTEYIRALNFVISDKSNLYVSNYYNEDDKYFNLHAGSDSDTKIICSKPFYESSIQWTELENYTTELI